MLWRGFYLKTSLSHLLLRSSFLLLVAPLEVAAAALHVRTEAVQALLFVPLSPPSILLSMK